MSVSVIEKFVQNLSAKCSAIYIFAFPQKTKKVCLENISIGNIMDSLDQGS